MADRIVHGSRVTLAFRLLLEDGTLVDEASVDEPLQFEVGDGTLVAGLESLLVALEPGIEERFLVAPEQAFGYRDRDNVHDIERADFPVGMALEPGTVIAFAAPSGEEVPGMVLSADERSVRVDFNHPLAGRALTFEVNILAVD